MVRITPAQPVTIHGRDAHDRLIAESDGIVYVLTDCCEASVTGTVDGAACRHCFRPVPDSMGMAWTSAEWAEGIRSGVVSITPRA